MKIIIGNDHGGVALKHDMKQRLEAEGHKVINAGVDSEETKVDYPDVAKNVVALMEKEDALGLLICGTGLGIGMAANKMKGIRCATCSDTFSARMAREHNNANILAVGARVVGNELAWELVKIFFQSQFKGGRHQARVDKMMELEG